MQGNDFGPGPDPGLLTGHADRRRPERRAVGNDSRMALPPSRSARSFTPAARACSSRRSAQTPTWDETTGQWAGTGVAAPVVNLAVYTNALSVEITSGGSIVYGYNWNAKTASTGTYRLTFVLDGNDAVGPVCNTPLATKFEAGGTQLVNLGEANPPGISMRVTPTSATRAASPTST